MDLQGLYGQIPTAQELYERAVQYIENKTPLFGGGLIEEVFEKCSLKYGPEDLYEQDMDGFGTIGYRLKISIECPPDVKNILKHRDHFITHGIHAALAGALPRRILPIIVSPKQEYSFGENGPNKAVHENIHIDVHNQAVGAERTVVWESLRFRSESERRIAIALDRVPGVLFFPNSKARLGDHRDRQNREPDFLICYKGKWGILEVDGEPYHPPTRTVEDHARDRLFHLHGLRVIQHFDAAECFENAEKVVKQFLFLLERNG